MRYRIQNLAFAIRRIHDMQIEVDGVVQMSSAGQRVFDLCVEILQTNKGRALITGVSFDADRSSWLHYIEMHHERLEIFSSKGSLAHDFSTHWCCHVTTTVRTSVSFKRMGNIIKIMV